MSFALTKFHTDKTTIAAAASLSGAIDFLGKVLLGVILPSGFDTASLTFQASIDGVTYFDVYDEDGSEITWSGAVASRCLLSGGATPMIGGFPFLKIRSGTTGAAVAQGDAVILDLILGIPNP